MELHLIKFILISAFLLGIYEVSVIHIGVMVLTTIAVTSRTNTQAIYSGVISLVIGIFLVLKMVYQMNFNEQSHFDANCNSTVRLLLFRPLEMCTKQLLLLSTESKCNGDNG